MSNMKEEYTLHLMGDPTADTLLIQPVDDRDLEWLPQEYGQIRELSPTRDFCLAAVAVSDWNADLSPWPAPAVFGNEDFGDSAPRTLRYLTETLLKDPQFARCRRICLGGYSLAGLFALWAGYQTDVFSGIAAASPSVWFPRFTEYMQTHTMQADAVYLSLGDREEKTRNPVMARVGDAIRGAQDILYAAGKQCTLEWNPGNHFKDANLRMAKAFAWLMENERMPG